MLQKLQKWAYTLKDNLYTLYLSYHRKDVSLIAKIVAIIIVSYALSPIDFIPDFIPIIGFLDDIILLPLGIALAIKLIPKVIWNECKIKAQKMTLRSLPRSKVAALVVVVIWILTLIIIFI